MRLFNVSMIRCLKTIAKCVSFQKNSVNFSTKASSSAAVAAMNDLKGRHLVWLDLELTGLDIERDHIMEIGCLVTDANLHAVGQGVNLVIHQPDVILDGMNEWCRVHHGQSGLTEECRRSDVTLQMAQSTILEYLEKHTTKGVCPIAGNSVHEDRRFLIKHMPQLVQHFHYRIVDVSSVKELCRRWYPAEMQNVPVKKFAHRCLSDIYESINELSYYRQSIFKQ